jgi:hypothetical protein
MKRGRVVSVERDGVKKEKGALSGGKAKPARKADAPRDALSRNENRRVPKRTTLRLPVRNEHHDSRRAGDETRARAVARLRTHHGVTRPVARRGTEPPVQLRLDVGRDVHERPALARHVLAVRRREQAKCHRDARETAAGAGTREAAGRFRAATRG